MNPALPPPTLEGRSWAGLRQGFARRDFVASLPTALLAWFLTVIFSVSLAALIFRGALEPYLALGISMSLLTATTVGLLISLLGSLPGTIAIPNDRTAPMLAILVASIAASFPAGTPGDTVLQTCLAALLLTTFLTGILLALLGRYRLGRIVRFLPLPVVGGFMAGAGWLLVKGAFTVLTGIEPSLSHVADFFQPGEVSRWASGLAMAVVLIIATRRFKHFLVIPTVVVASVCVFYLVDVLSGMSLADLRLLRWLPGPFPDVAEWQPLSLHLLHAADWGRIFRNADAIASILLVTATSLLMISSALELSANTEVDADLELEAAGIANLAGVVGGGLVGFHSLSITDLAIRIGPRSRWVGVLTAVGCGLTLLVGPNLVSYLPIPVLGGLLLFLGLKFLMEWLVDARQRMPRTDYLIVVLILIVMAWAGYLVGVGTGLVLAAAFFAYRYSRVDIVRLELSGLHHRSNVDRTAHEQEVLRPLRPAILILKLQGFIFFGTAHQLLHRIRQRAHDGTQPRLRYVFLDFRHVTGIDSSTLLSFAKLLQFSHKLGFKVTFTSLPPVVLRALSRDHTLFAPNGFHRQPDLDHGIGWCESRELEPFHALLSSAPGELVHLLQTALPDRPGAAQGLVRHFTRQEAYSGTVLAVQGERTRDLFLIQQGQVSAIFRPETGESIRLRTLGPGSVVGEIGLYLNLPRTASLVVDTKSIIWRLSPESLTRMETEDPLSAAALHEFLARTVAHRLVQANELLQTALR